MSDEERYRVDPPVPPDLREPSRRRRRAERDDLDERATEIVEGGIGLARLALGGAWRTGHWGVSTSREIAERVVGALASGDSVTQAANEAAAGARDALFELAGFSDAVPDDHEHGRRRRADQDRPDLPELRRRGAELLRRSSDVTDTEDTHPAYGRILADLAPDEARILRLLHAEGPQPSVDVRSSSVVPNDSELVEEGLTMIGELAGCRHMERTQQYLNNLFRLGLVWFSGEALRDPDAYQVLEAQPEVTEAMARSRRSKTIRRSIHLTPFGHDFVGTVLTFEAPPGNEPPPVPPDEA